MFADGFGHLEHIQPGFSKDRFQLFVGYDFPPLFWILQFVLFDVGPHLLRDSLTVSEIILLFVKQI